MRQCTPYSDLVVSGTPPIVYPRQASEDRAPYEPYLDKITERELVPDIVHRLKIDEKVEYNGFTIASRHDDLLALIAKMCRVSNFPAILEQFATMQTGTINIAAGTSSGVVTFIFQNNHPEVLYAVSKQTGMDYKDAVSMNVANGIITVSLNTPVNFSSDEEIQVIVS